MLINNRSLILQFDCINRNHYKLCNRCYSVFSTLTELRFKLFTLNYNNIPFW